MSTNSDLTALKGGRMKARKRITARRGMTWPDPGGDKGAFYPDRLISPVTQQISFS